MKNKLKIEKKKASFEIYQYLNLELDQLIVDLKRDKIQKTRGQLINEGIEEILKKYKRKLKNKK